MSSKFGHYSSHIIALLILAGGVARGSSGHNQRAVVARAGEAATIPCPGLSDTGAPGGYIVNQLQWSCAPRASCPAADGMGRLVEYVARSVQILGDEDRVSLNEHSWSLVLAPVKAADAATYSCFFNSQSGERRLVKLAVLDVPSAPGMPVVLQYFSREVELSWVPSFQTNNSPIQHYVVQTRQGEDGGWPPLEEGLRTADNTTTTATVTGLIPFSVYTFRVVSVNELGASEPSRTSYPIHTIRERPGAAPRLTGVSNVTAASVQVNWEPPPASSLHGEFIYYRLTYRAVARPSTPPTELLLHDRLQTAHVIDGLRPYMGYEITLQVKNPKDLGPMASITAVTGEGAPTRPENVSVTEVNDRSLTLTWLSPRESNGILQEYRVYWTSQGEPIAKERLPADELRTYTLTELEPITGYTIWLTAATSAGEGERSAPVRTSTDVSGPGPPDITNITCPTDVTLGLQWRRPERMFGPVDLYFVLYRYGESWDYVERVVPVPSDQLEYSILLPNLTSKQIYEIRIQGATVSQLDSRRVYKGQQSLPRKVRVERGCDEIQPFSTWKHRPRASLANTGTLAGIVTCLLLLLVIGMAAVWRRRRKRYSSSPQNKRSPAGPSPGWSAPAHDAVPCNLFVQHVHQLHVEDGDALRREWETLQLRAPLGDASQTSAAQQKAKQNGAPPGTDVASLTYQPSPVPLRSRLYRGRPVPAVYAVDGYRRAHAFLVAERPAVPEYDALWRLVWEQGVHVVVLVGSLASYSDRFWPEPGCIRPSVDLQVEGQSECTLATSVVRHLTLSKLKGRSRTAGRERRLVLYQYTGWPEYGLPDNPLPLLDFVQRSSEHEGAADGPLLVISGSSHGSLSLYVGLASLLSQLRRRQELAVFSYWNYVIGQSPFFLTTLEEYSFLHDCLLERVTSGVTSVPRDLVCRYTEELQGGRRNSYPYPAAERQYMSAVSLEPHQYTVTSAVKPCNQSKNISLGFLPTEAARVSLTPKLSVEGSDYINASWLPGFRQVQEYIATQHPLPGTVLDFWQMIRDNRVTTVVCLTPEECGVFWPLEEEEIDCESYMVRYMSETVSDEGTPHRPFVTRSFLMESTEGEDDVMVRLLHLPRWPHDVPLAQVMVPVQRAMEVQGERRTPLVVIDRHGGTEAASFCLFGSVLRQLHYEEKFDVFTFAKLYHQRRPGIWRSVAEYLYLYHVVEAWLSASDPDLTAGGTLTRPSPRPAVLEAKLDGVNGVVV